jgi:hypothetical protein
LLLPAVVSYLASICPLLPVLCLVLANAFTLLPTERLLQARQLCALQLCLIAPSPCCCDRLQVFGCCMST